MVEEDDIGGALFELFDTAGMQYYDRTGAAMSRGTWSDLFSDVEKFYEYKRVAETQIGPIYVSTVWLGLDHNYSPRPHKPLIFETMVFLKDTGARDIDMRRYETEEQARAGHEEVCAEVRAMLHIPDSPGAGE